MNRFTILKTSWGIAIFYNIKELLNFEKDDNDTYEVYPLIFLKMKRMFKDVFNSGKKRRTIYFF